MQGNYDYSLGGKMYFIIHPFQIYIMNEVLKLPWVLGVKSSLDIMPQISLENYIKEIFYFGHKIHWVSFNNYKPQTKFQYYSKVSRILSLFGYIMIGYQFD